MLHGIGTFLHRVVEKLTMILDALLPIFSQIETGTILILTSAALLTWLYYTNRNLPPGPWGLPILGIIPFFDRKIPAEEQFHDICKKYGNIVSMQLGSFFLVVLDDFDTIKEAYVKQGDVFSGRPDGRAMKVHESDRGVLATDGKSWREHRRFALSTLRDYGMGKLSLEPRMVEEIHCFLEELSKAKGQPIDINPSLGMSTANIISTLEFGKRFEYDDKEFAYLRHLQDEFVEYFGALRPRGIFNWLKYVPFAGQFSGQNAVANIQLHIRKFLRGLIEDHKKDYNENSRKDYIDAFFTERNETIKRTGNEGFFDVNEELEATLQMLFTAGTETTTSTLRWAALFLLINPEMQQKIHKEIDDVIGMERAPTMSDQKQMKYTEAFLLEVQRCGSIVPLNLPHATLEETVLKGYRIPKRSIIASNLYAVHHDPKLWKCPEVFQPERFINDQGQIEKPEYLIPFGIGKRSCLGESLARMELFMYFTSLLQRFTLLPPEGLTPKLEFESTAVRRPKLYQLLAVEREGYQVT